MASVIETWRAVTRSRRRCTRSATTSRPATTRKGSSAMAIAASSSSMVASSPGRTPGGGWREIVELVRERVEIGAAVAAGRSAGRFCPVPCSEEDQAMRMLGRGNPGARRQAVERLAGEGDVHGISRDGRFLRANALGAEELLLEPELVAGVAGERAGRPDDAVAGDDDRQRIPSERLRHRPSGCGLPDLAGEAGVRRHGAVRDFRGGGEHVSVEVAADEPEIEWPFEPRALALEILHQLPVARLDLGAILDGLHAAHVGEPRMSNVPARTQVLDQRDALLRLSDQDLAQRGGEDAVRDGAVSKSLEARLEALSRPSGGCHGDRNSPDRPHDTLDSSIPLVFAGAGGTAVDVPLHALVGDRIGVAGGAGDDVGLDIGAHARLVHRWISICCDSPRLWRILRRA